MKPLNAEYKSALELIAKQIQESEEYNKYLEEEEEEDYQQLREMFEPKIADIHKEVATAHPLQLVTFERELLDDKYEGLFLPKILGYAVLRGEVSDQYKFVRPQQHFKDILIAICMSSNFDAIKKRIGQTIQTGFALSSDIWITNLINLVSNKRIRYFLQNQKLPKFRNLKDRKIGYIRYSNQFKNENFHSAKFPKNLSELKVEFSSLKLFIEKRIQQGGNNSTIIEEIKRFLDTPDFQSTDEMIDMLGLYANFFDLEKGNLAHLNTVFNKVREMHAPEFDSKWMDFLLKTHSGDLDIDATADNRISTLVNTSIQDDLVEFYSVTDIVHSQGYNSDQAVEAVRVAYGKHEGVSKFNECLRQTIFAYIKREMSPLGVENYPSYFEISKIFPTYIELFGNQQFNQDIKDLCMKYVKSLLKKYTDKRGKDYQDIKKFVSTNFLDLGFLKQKEIIELFKTRRKKKVPAR